MRTPSTGNPADRGQNLPQINAQRLWQRHMMLARIGAIDGGGNCRLCMSHDDGQARDLFAQWCQEAGLEMRVDLVGNMFAIRRGAHADAPMVVAGSHLDTQPHGGRFDGISGVLAALEMVETLNDTGLTTQAPVAIVNWTNEEGVRYAPGLMGSSWFVGRLSDDDVLNAVASDDGRRFEEEARARNYLGTLRPDDFDIAAYYELHIEQGPLLEKENCQIGVVESVQGLRWLEVQVSGMDGHAGTTPMDQRQDTIQASARILCTLNDLGLAHGPDARITVGRLKPHTDGVSTIAGRTDFVVDIRHPDVNTLDSLVVKCRRLCAREAEGQNCAVEATLRIAVEPGAFDAECVSHVESAARKLGYQYRRMTSGALHDASNMIIVAPSAMIFVPCKDGLSHNVRESATMEDLAAGCNVLLHSVLASAGRG